MLRLASKSYFLLPEGPFLETRTLQLVCCAELLERASDRCEAQRLGWAFKSLKAEKLIPGHFLAMEDRPTLIDVPANTFIRPLQAQGGRTLRSITGLSSF